jgi:glycosyltransferase involved in cell wall biosynthesis
MKLLVVTPYFYPKSGGLENYAYKFCEALQRLYNWRIVIVTSNHKSKKDNIEFVNGMKVYRLGPMYRLSNTPVNPFWIKSIKAIIKQERPDLINAHTPVPFIADVAAIVSGKIPFFVTYHAYTLKKQSSPLLNIITTLYKYFENLLFQRADKIIVVSDAIKDAIPSRFSKKVVTINNSLPKNEIPGRITNDTKKSHSLVFIGNLDKSHNWKGLDSLLLAMKSIAKNTTLTVIGDGNAKETYKKAAQQYGIKNRVKFVGKKTGQAKNKILEKAMIGIICPKTSNDAFPTVALEYWAYSLPIIASDIEPLNKIFSHKKTAFLVDSKDSKKLATATEVILKNIKLQKDMGKMGYHEVVNKYILEKEVKKFMEIAKEYSK